MLSLLHFQKSEITFLHYTFPNQDTTTLNICRNGFLNVRSLLNLFDTDIVSIIDFGSNLYQLKEENQKLDNSYL